VEAVSITPSTEMLVLPWNSDKVKSTTLALNHPSESMGTYLLELLLSDPVVDLLEASVLSRKK
jgi:hypothetical protein